MIPQKIYYIWIGGQPINEEIQSNIESWKKYNPSFTICKIDESNFNINKYSYIKDAYNSGNFAYASDLIRLVVLYQHGGFYFDTDTKLIKPLNNLLKYKSIWALETPGIVASGLIIGTQKKDDDLKNLIDIYKHKKFDPEHLYDLLTTKIVSEYFQTKGLKPINKFQILRNKTVIFPSDYFAPYHWWGGGHITKNTIAIQQYTKKWGSQDKISLIGKLKLNFKYNYPRLSSLIKKIKNRKK